MPPAAFDIFLLDLSQRLSNSHLHKHFKNISVIFLEWFLEKETL